MALPAMAALRAAFPDAQLIVAAAPAVAPLFQEITAGLRRTQVLVVDKRARPRSCARRKADARVLFTNSFRTAWVCRRAGIAKRWGYRAHGRRCC